jgi:hypothetical protein
MRELDHKSKTYYFYLHRQHAATVAEQSSTAVLQHGTSNQAKAPL